MKTIIVSMAIAMLCMCLQVNAGEKKAEIKWDMEYLDQTWGIKLKSAKVDEQKNEVKMLLEFTKDVTELQQMREAFQTTENKGTLWFLFFDEDNVAFAKSKVKSVDGELSGKAGDAFRIVLPAPESNPKAFSITRKVSARPSDLSKKAPPKNFTNSIGMKFVWIPPGTFLMGSPKEEKERLDNETQHKVKLTQGFYMGVYTVTQEQYETVMGKNPSFFKGEKNLPVEQVSWGECQEFVKKLREKDKKAYRLPTEAEWEYACRAGTTTPFHFGETISTDQVNYNGDFTYGDGKKGVFRNKTTPVGSFPANAWGLHDMHGNVWQWCEDRYADYPQKDVTDPQGPEKGEFRVLRGGSWGDSPEGCRSACRSGNGPGNRDDFFGLRVCFCLD